MSEQSTRTRLEAASILAGQALLWVTLFATVLVIAGWALDVRELKRLWLADTAIPSSTAISISLFCIASLLNFHAAKTKFATLPGKIVSFVLISAAAATLVESFSGQEFNLALSLLPKGEDVRGLTFPGPMAPNISAQVLLLGAALLFPKIEIKGRSVCQLSLLIIVLAAMSSMIGHAFGVEFMCTMLGCIKIPAVSSLLFGMAAVAAVMTAPRVGFMERLCGDDYAGQVARRLSLTFLSVPLALWLRQDGVSKGIFDQNFGWFAFCAFTIVLFWRSINIGSQGVAVVSEAKKEVEKKLQESSNALNEIYRAKIAEKDAGINVHVVRMKKVCVSCAQSFSLDIEYCPEDGSQLYEVRDDNLVGRIFADRYLVTDFLGKGGMSSVYKAQHTYMHKTVALKILLPHLACDPKSIRRFQREAKSASLLRHPNLLEVHDFGVTPDGEAFIVMQFVEGISLADYLAERKRLDLELFYTVFEQVCAGLSHAHSEGVIHRDLKPSNVMMNTAGGAIVVQVIDFGLAKLEGEDAALRITNDSEVIGSPLYMSPEAYSSSQLTVSADIYSLGCLMYEALQGDPPFLADSITETVMKQLYHDPKPLPAALAVPSELEKLIQSMLNKEPENRPSIESVLESIRKVAATKVAPVSSNQNARA